MPLSRALWLRRYLSDVKEGGGTNFPYISSAGEDGLTVSKPKRATRTSTSSIDCDSYQYAGTGRLREATSWYSGERAGDSEAGGALT